MHCPYCQEIDTRVIDSRLVSEASQIRRRRECPVCLERFTTFEVAELLMPFVIKRDGRRDAFDARKLRNGITVALNKRPVSAEQIDATLAYIQRSVMASGEREVSSQFIGEIAMKALHELDNIAFIRFASVYLNFQSTEEFQKAIASLIAGQ